jgi:hypothetical protein
MTSATTDGMAPSACLRRSRHGLGQVIIGVIGWSVLTGLARESRARARARLAAWDKTGRLS